MAGVSGLPQGYSTYRTTIQTSTSQIFKNSRGVSIFSRFKVKSNAAYSANDIKGNGPFDFAKSLIKKRDDAASSGKSTEKIDAQLLGLSRAMEEKLGPSGNPVSTSGTTPRPNGMSEKEYQNILNVLRYTEFHGIGFDPTSETNLQIDRMLDETSESAAYAILDDPNLAKHLSEPLLGDSQTKVDDQVSASQRESHMQDAQLQDTVFREEVHASAMSSGEIYLNESIHEPGGEAALEAWRYIASAVENPSNKASSGEKLSKMQVDIFATYIFGMQPRNEVPRVIELFYKAGLISIQDIRENPTLSKKNQNVDVWSSNNKEKG